jgi:hypothetical protein
MSKQKQIVELIRDYVKNTPLKGVHKIVIENEPEFSKYDKNTIRFYLTFIVDNEQSDFMEPIWKSKMNYELKGENQARNYENELGDFIKKYLGYTWYNAGRGFTDLKHYNKNKLRESLNLTNTLKNIIKESIEDDVTPEMIKEFLDSNMIDIKTHQDSHKEINGWFEKKLEGGWVENSQLFFYKSYGVLIVRTVMYDLIEKYFPLRMDVVSEGIKLWFQDEFNRKVDTVVWKESY